METITSTQDRPALVIAAFHASVAAGEGLHGKAYLSDVATRVGCSVGDLHANLQSMLGNFMLLRGDTSSAADSEKLRKSRVMECGEPIYFLDVIS